MGTEYLHLRSIHEAINGNYIFFFPETDTFLFCFFFKPNWSLKKKKTWSRNFFLLWKTINITSNEQTTAYKYKRDLKEKDCEDQTTGNWIYFFSGHLYFKQ